MTIQATSENTHKISPFFANDPSPALILSNTLCFPLTPPIDSLPFPFLSPVALLASGEDEAPTFMFCIINSCSLIKSASRAFTSFSLIGSLDPWSALCALDVDPETDGEVGCANSGEFSRAVFRAKRSLTSGNERVGISSFGMAPWVGRERRGAMLCYAGS